MTRYVHFDNPADLEAWLAYRPVPAAIALRALTEDVDVTTPTPTTEPRPRSLLDRIKRLLGR